MLYWQANFQIPNSGVQAFEVFAIADTNSVKYYADRQQTILLFEKFVDFPENQDKYEYLLTLPEFEPYVRI